MEAVFQAYYSWKQTARKSRTDLKSPYSPEALDRIEQEISAKCNALKDHYENILRNQAITPEIVTRMDTCVTLTEETTNLVKKVRITPNKAQYGSGYGPWVWALRNHSLRGVRGIPLS